MNWDTFLAQLANWLSARKLLQRDARWVVGASGGPDSTLLLHALIDLSSRESLGWAIHAAHLHHGLRAGDADADERFVAALAERLGVSLHSERADIRSEVAQGGGTTEEVARNRRYEFLERVALTTGSECVAVAHHADDNAETVFHRICRGTGLRGLAGMADTRAIQPGSRVRLVRPLLQMKRTEIEALCTARGIEFQIDETNTSPSFTRGRIRTTILPLLREQLNPNVSEALLRLAEQARRLGTYLEDAAARTFDSLLVAEEPGRIVLNVSALRNKQYIVQAEVVRRAIAMLAPSEQDLGFGHIEAVLRLVEDSASGKEIHLPGSVVARKQYDRLEFRPLVEEEPPPPLETLHIACPGRTGVPQLAAELVVDVRELAEGGLDRVREKPHPYEEWLDYDRVVFPLVLRARREGDRFHPLGAPGAKTLADFFIEQKVEPSMRARIGVLCDQLGPIWVLPLRIDERVKLRPGTRRVLCLTLHSYAARKLGAS
ncbi:tRNA(Ile)-lysidine synthase [Phycisphaerae bacterium RAS1]|nr:tRNA(Ile)-lysidine synthase [Phycisphaerae bacterium RAS1]